MAPKLRRLTAEQMESDQGRIYGLAPVPGARFEVNGVFYDANGFECLLPGQKRREAEPEPAPEPEPEPTEEEVKIQQFKAYLDSITRDDQKEELRGWMADNCDVKYHPNLKLSTMKERALKDYTAVVMAEVGGDADEEAGAADADKEAA